MNILHGTRISKSHIKSHQDIKSNLNGKETKEIKNKQQMKLVNSIRTIVVDEYLTKTKIICMNM